MKTLQLAYQKEQQHFRQLAERFCERYPQYADHMLPYNRTPAQEQLCQEVQLQVAQLNCRLEKSFPASLQRLLQQICPQALKANPSEVMIAIDGATLKRAFTLPAKTKLRIEDMAFQTLSATELKPLWVAQKILKNHQLILRIDKSHSAFDLRKVNGLYLLFTVTGPYESAVTAWSQIHFNCKACHLNQREAMALRHPKSEPNTNPYQGLVQYLRQPEALLQFEIGPLFFEEDAEHFQCELNFSSDHDLKAFNHCQFQLNVCRAQQLESCEIQPIESHQKHLRQNLQLENSKLALFEIQTVRCFERGKSHKGFLPPYQSHIPYDAPYYQLLHKMGSHTLETEIECFNLSANATQAEILSFEATGYREDCHIAQNTLVYFTEGPHTVTATTAGESCPAIPVNLDPEILWQQINGLSLRFQSLGKSCQLQTLLIMHQHFATHAVHHQHWSKRLSSSILFCDNKSSQAIREGRLVFGTESHIEVEDSHFTLASDCDLLGFVLARILADFAPLNQFHHTYWHHKQSSLRRRWLT